MAIHQSERRPRFHFTEQRAGITLIELMIVVGIISILAVVGQQNYLKFRRRAYMAEMRTTIGLIRADLSSRTGQDSPTRHTGRVLFGYGRTYAGRCHLLSATVNLVGDLNLSGDGCERMRWSYLVGVNFTDGIPDMDTLTMTILSRYYDWSDRLYYNSLTGEQTSTNYDEYGWTLNGGYVTRRLTRD